LLNQCAHHKDRHAWFKENKPPLYVIKKTCPQIHISMTITMYSLCPSKRFFAMKQYHFLVALTYFTILKMVQTWNGNWTTHILLKLHLLLVFWIKYITTNLITMNTIARYESFNNKFFRWLKFIIITHVDWSLFLVETYYWSFGFWVDKDIRCKINKDIFVTASIQILFKK
jgi:hypothetical protein